MTVADSYYQADYIPDPARTGVWKEIVRFASQHVNLTGTVLDLGAGYCDFINNVPAATRYAVDSSPEITQHAAAGVTVVQSRAWEFPAITDGSVDVVHASNILEHFTDEELEKVVSEIRRVLKPSGTLIAMQPNYAYTYREYFDDPTHKKVFTHVTLRAFLEMHGFTVRLLMPRFLPFSMRSKPSLIPTFLTRVVVWMYLRSPWKPFAGQMYCIAEKHD